MTTPTSLPETTRIGRTALTVTDLESMRGFYRDIVGLTVLDESPESATLGVESHPLLVLEADETAPDRAPASAGLFHTAFRVPSREALGDALARVREEWQLAGASDHGVSEALYLADPEGNGIEIYRDYPRADWPRTEDGQIRMGTYPLDLEPIDAAAAGATTLPAGTDVGHVHLEVTSLSTFDDFSVETVGFEEQASTPGATFVAAGGYHHHLGANTWNRRTAPASGRGLAWFEVVLPSDRALADLRERLEASSYPVSAMNGTLAVTGPDEIAVRFTTP